MRRAALLLTAGLLLAAPVLPAQEGPAAFDSREWDFGAIREADGEVRHAFQVFNSSDRPLRLERAIPGCSCIRASLPSKAIAPGQGAAVEVFFSPAGASGPVLRTVELYASGNHSLGVLSVSADVMPSDRSIQERYPVVLAEGLYASRADIHFGYLERGRASGKAFFIANAGERPMRLRAEGLESTFYRVRCPELLAPGEEARVEVWCDTPADPSFFATLRASLRLVPDGGRVLRELPLVGLCLTEALESPDAPRLRNNPVQLRRRPLSRRLRGTLTFFNDGRSDLVLHALELPAGLSCPFSPGTRLAPGAVLKLSLKGSAMTGFGRKGSSSAMGSTGRAFPRSGGSLRPVRSKPVDDDPEIRITVFSNDPLRPSKEISIQVL